MKRGLGLALVLLVAGGLAISGCKQQHTPKNYLQSQSSDARRAMDSMPSPTGGN